MCEFCESKKPIKIFPGPISTHFSTSQKFIIDGLVLKVIYHMSEYVDIGRYEPERDVPQKMVERFSTMREKLT